MSFVDTNCPAISLLRMFPSELAIAKPQYQIYSMLLEAYMVTLFILGF